MYALLLFDTQDPDFPWRVRFFLSVDLAAPSLNTAQTSERVAALKQIKAEMPKITKTEFDNLTMVCMALPLQTKDLVFFLYLALAHLRLPEERRMEREARIAQCLDTYFKGAPMPPEIASGIKHIKLLAPLVPDAYMECMVGSQATRLQMVSAILPAWGVFCVPQLNRLESLTNALGIQSRSEADRILVNALFSRVLAEREGFLDLVAFAGKNKLAVAVQKTAVALQNSELMIVSEGDILVGILKDCREANLDGSMLEDIDAVVFNQVALGRAAELNRMRFLLGATIDAMREDVPLGAEALAHNMEAIVAASQAWWQQLLRMTPQRLRSCKKPAPALVSTHSATDTAANNLDPVHAWSVSRLLRWIEGPIVEADPVPLDRAKFLLKEKAMRQEARVKTKMPAKAVRADQDLTASDIDLAVMNALGITAGFFMGDIDDMLFRAKVLGSASPAVQACADLLEPLRSLQNDQKPDDQKARVLLHRASVSIDMLRSDIKTIESDVRLRQRFAQRLEAALSAEALVEGKRHGGVINCALKRSDWPWVAEFYHRRWLPWSKRVIFDGVPRTLQPDQALGLYVTGKSLSGYEFDVSLHLWQRKPGRNSSPGTSITPFSPMNTNDWIDTLTPCAVLHVPCAS